MTETNQNTDFFISFTQSDSAWAEWIAWQLEDAGYTTVLQLWDFPAGSNFVHEMDRASKEAEHTLAILSSDYHRKTFPTVEWTAAFKKDPLGVERRLIPVRIEQMDVEGLLGPIVYVDLVGLDSVTARTRLLAGVGASLRRTRGKPTVAPRFPLSPSGRTDVTSIAPVSANDTVSGTIPIQASVKRRFLCARLPAEDWLAIEKPTPPYFQTFDSTDDDAPRKEQDLHVILWLPAAQYLRSSPLQEFTPLASIFTPDLNRIIAELTHFGEDALQRLRLPPNKVRNEEKTVLYGQIAEALSGCFIATVSVPKLVLGVGRNSPPLAYQALLDAFLLPLLQLHRRLLFSRIGIHLAPIGAEGRHVLSASKKIARGVFARSGTVRVDFAQDQLLNVVSITRFLAWAVGTFHNSGNRQWIDLLERLLNENATGPSPREEPVKLTPHA